MEISLNQEIAEHLERVKNLAIEAEHDKEQGFQSRSSAMTGLTSMLTQLTKSQESLITMERQQRTEQAIIDTLKEYLDEEQLGHVLEALERALSKIE